MWGLGQMDVWKIEHAGANGHFGTDEHWGKWALRANAYLGKMGSTKNEQKGKRIFAANGQFGA